MFCYSITARAVLVGKDVCQLFISDEVANYGLRMGQSLICLFWTNNPREMEDMW